MSSRLFSLLALAVPVVMACAGAAHAEVTEFSDHFDDGAGCSDLSPWTANDGSRVGVNTMTSNSGNCSLFIHGAGITATTPTMDLAHPSADLSLWVRKGDDSFSDEPGSDDDLELQYRNSSGSWVQLYFFDAGAYAGGQVISGMLTLPSAALHSTAAFRLYQHGGGTGEYWHLDDFTVTAPNPLEVTSTADTDTIGTLRYAINWANANAGEDAITFDIPGSGPHVITLTSALPQITDAGISIDGSTQDGASCGTAFNSYGGLADRDLRIGIDANGQSGLDVTAENVTIRGIAIGNTSAEGVVVNGNNFALHCSHVGTDAAGTANLGTGTSGVFLSGAQSATIGDGTAAGRNLVGNAGNIGLYVRNSTATISGNLIGVANNGLDAGNTSRGIYIHKSTATITGNVIANSSQSGVGLVSVGGSAAILSNSIYDNDKLGIDLQGGTADSYGVGTNDAGDTDSGPNDYLNHPVINRITADGSSSIEYDFNLDVPSSGNGYRIEFFRDTSPDPSGHGEGEIFLGALDISHSGGDTRFTGTLALGETVSPGDTITTTATRKTGPSSYDITSEFGANVTALSPLVVSTTADSGTGSLRSAIAHANANAGDDAITFSIPGSGPHVIALNSTLTITDEGVSLDGTTQPSTTCGNAQTGIAHDLTVELDGGGDWITVLQVDASNVSVQGIAFTHANSMGLEIVSGSGNSASCNNFGLGADGVTLSAVGAGGQPAVRIAGTGAVMSNNVLAQSGGDGFKVETGASALISGNRVYGSGYDGVSVDSWALSAAIIGNAIYDNNERPIDLGATDGVNANDVGDGDTGPNDLLNFPEIAEVAANGGTSFSYDFNLDVPANANGYRIDFFKSSSADPTGYGEGETFLGALDIAHSGGSQNFAGTFSASATLAVGEIVTATTTRKTGAASYDITSEYSGAVAATEAPAPLVVTSTADTDTLGTLRYAINWANANAADDEITFNIAGAGPHTIALSSALPVLTDDGITIDGTSQSGASCGNLKDGTPHDLRIHLQGASQAFHGIEMNATGLRIEGLSLTDFNNGIRGRGGADSAQLQCNYVGVEPDGSTAGANGQGIYLLGATSGTTIFNNLISASTQSGVLLASTNGLSNITLTGNLIGTNESGTSAIPNTSDGIRVNTTNASSNITVFGNVLSGNGDNGLELANVATATVQANIIGLDRSGTADLGNGTDGIEISGGSGITVGGDLALYRNVISGNGRSGISLIDANTGTVVAGNHIGTDASGFSGIQNDADGINGDSITSLTVGGSTSAHRNIISGNFGDGIFVDGASTGLTIRNNWIGVDASGNAALGNQDENVQLEETGVTGALLQDNVISGASGATAGGSSYGVILYLGSQATFLGNRIGVGADGVTALQNDTAGLAVHGSTALATIGDGTVAGENIISSNGGPGLYVIGGTAIVRGGSISNNGAQGVRVNGGSFASVGTVYGGNGGLAIDLGNDGVTANDTGDGDSGPSNLLNFPVVNRIDADGSTTVGYDFSLDVPSSANGYRVEFFRATSADATGYGEGETLLAALDVAHSGGDTRFSGSFTASAAVSVGDIVTAIATRKTGAGSHDITSEFSLSYTVTDETPANLAATKSVAVLDDGLIGGDDTVAIPGATLRYQIALSNTGEGAADAGSTVIVDEIPSNGALKVADFGGFPGTGPVLFSDGSPSSGLSYTFGSLGSGADDIQFSSDNGSSWTYAPSDSGDGTDPAVTHIRLTPGGAFAGGSGTPPSASIAYDVVLF